MKEPHLTENQAFSLCAKPRRPSRNKRNKVKMFTNVSPDLRQEIEALAEEHGECMNSVCEKLMRIGLLHREEFSL